MTKFEQEVWENRKIGDLVERNRQPVDVQPDLRYREIGVRSHGKGIFYKDSIFGRELGNKRVFWIEPDCFVVNIVFAWEQAVAKTTTAELGFIASHRFPMYKPVDEKLDLDYLLYFFKTPRGKYLLGLASPGGAGRNKTLGQQAFIDLSIPTPPIEEQRKIAEILSTWDEAIRLTEDLIAAKQQRKKGLMQRLLTGQVRFPGFEGRPWREVRFNEVFERVTRKNTVDNQNALTISAQLGLVNQQDFFNKRIASKDLSKYYLLKKGEFAYNKSYSKGYPFGAIKRLDYYDAGVLSTLYICFRLNDGDYDPDFFAHFFEAGRLNKGIYSIAQEGARNHGLLNIGVRDFFTLPLLIPSLEEQKKISQVLNAADTEIQLLDKKLVALQEQKKGLMQRLLTGQVRVEV